MSERSFVPLFLVDVIGPVHRSGPAPSKVFRELPDNRFIDVMGQWLRASPVLRALWSSTQTKVTFCHVCLRKAALDYPTDTFKERKDESKES